MEKKSRVCFAHIKVKCPLDIYVEMVSLVCAVAYRVWDSGSSLRLER